jgi:hypothetical protein
MEPNLLFSISEMELNQEEIKEQRINGLKEEILNIDNLISRQDDHSPFFMSVDNLVDWRIKKASLLKEKRLILEQINELTSDKKIETIQELVKQLPDEKLKRKLTDELSELNRGNVTYKQEMQGVFEAEAKIKLEQQRIDGLERKSKIWLSFLQRESAASIIGGIVLLMLTVALISGMICGKESQILSNGFLVILGYFFGQSSSKNKDGM